MGVFKNKNGGTFEMSTEEDAYVSILQGGYLITRDGQFIPVKDGEDHSSVFSEYINKYYCVDENHYQFYNTTEAITILVNDGNIVYIGKKAGDDLRSTDGAFIFIIPYEEIGLTLEQDEALKKLSATNVSIFSKKPIVDLTYLYLNGEPANIFINDQTHIQR